MFFKAISEEINALLQKATVMPSFPKALMAAATDSNGLGEPVNAVPNVVKVSVRVMHGEANLEMDEEDRTPGSDESREGRDVSMDYRSRPSFNRDRNSDRRKRSAPASFGGATPPRSSSRRSERRPERRFVPRDMIEIDAFPELAVINLQLSEIEFADPTVSVWRNRLRKELSNLKQLGKRYKKKAAIARNSPGRRCLAR